MTSPTLIVLIVLALVFLFLAMWMVSAYNLLVRLRQAVRNAWAQIDVQLKRRHDLIPNLVNTVKGYAGHERETLESVMNARAKATSVTIPADRIKAEGELSSALARLMAVSEAYPDLKANENFLSLQKELSGTEDRIAFSRQAYNESVKQMNTKVQSFPTLIIANLFGFKEEPFFEAPASAREAPKVQF
jgi:LemA protein